MSKKKKKANQQQQASYSGKRLSPPRTYQNYISRNGKIGRRPTIKYNSDFWRSRYATSYAQSSSVSEKYLLRKCLYDVARIANIYDPDTRLGYMENGKTYTSMDNKVVYLDPRLAVDKNIELGKKIDIYTGEILLGTALKRFHSDNAKLNYIRHLANIKEDKSLLEKAKSALFLSMEMNAAYHEVRKNTPGFKSYCHSRVDHLLENNPSDSLEKAFSSTEISGEAKISALVREIETFNSSPLNNYGDFSEVIEQVIDQVENLQTSEERLKFAEEIAEQYLKDQEQNEEEREGKNKRENSEQLIEENFRSSQTMGWKADDPDNTITSISESLTDNEKEKLEPKRPDEILIERIFEGNVRQVETRWKNPATYTDDPQVANYEDVSRETRAISEAIKDKLNFADADHKSWEERSLKSGELDEGGLDKFAYNSDRVFYQKEVFNLPLVQFGILVDESGSMERRIETAIKMAVALVNAISEVKGIDLHVYGHTGMANCVMFEYITPSTSKEDFHVLSYMKARHGNYDSFAIKAAGESMLKYSQKEYRRKLLFVISDGAPSGMGYGGIESEKHMRSISNWLREDHGLEVYGIGIDNAFDREEGERMYGKNKSIVLPDFDAGEVSNIISTFLEQITKE